MNAQSTCTKKNNIKTFPLEALLTLYTNRANYTNKNPCPNRLYLNYFEEFKLLIKFLGPFHYQVPPNYKPRQLQWWEGCYETQEIARHLKISQDLLIEILRNIIHE